MTPAEEREQLIELIVRQAQLNSALIGTTRALYERINVPDKSQDFGNYHEEFVLKKMKELGIDLDENPKYSEMFIKFREKLKDIIYPNLDFTSNKKKFR